MRKNRFNRALDELDDSISELFGICLMVLDERQIRDWDDSAAFSV